MDLLKNIINTKTNVRGCIITIDVQYHGETKPTVMNLDEFNETIEEYVDPRDVEIERLNKVIADLKMRKKKPRKMRKRLTFGEIAEIKELILKGESNTAIGNEYNVSDSTVSRFRIEMRKGGHDV